MSQTSDTSPEARAFHQDQDELIHVPKGQSRLRFILVSALVIFMLVIFVVSDLFQATAGSAGSSEESYLSYQGADGKVHSLSQADYFMEKRALTATIPQGRDIEDDQIARLLLVDNLARNAGVEITDDELADYILSAFGSPEAYHGYLGMNRVVTKTQFEAALRKQLRVQRYESMLYASAAYPDPTEAANRWKTANPEYSFDYVELTVEDVMDDARAEVPEGDGLSTWYSELNEIEQAKFKTEETIIARVAYLDLESDTSADKLLAAYPAAEDADLEVDAKSYYEGVRIARYRRETPLAPGQEGYDQQSPFNNIFKSFEDVEEEVRVQAPIYTAFKAWRDDMAARAESEEVVDLQAEATRVGMQYLEDGTPRSRTQWGEVAEWASPQFSANLFGQGSAGQLSPQVTVDKRAYAITLVDERKLPELPLFEAIVSDVTEEWVSQRAKELVLERLEGLRDQFGERPEELEGQPTPDFDAEATAEEFTASLASLGLTPSTTPFVASGTEPAAGWDAATAAEKYLANSFTLYQLSEGQVPAAAMDRDGERAYLVRCAGIQEPDLSKMTPADYQSAYGTLTNESLQEFIANTFTNREFLQEKFKMEFTPWNTDERDEDVDLDAEP